MNLTEAEQRFLKIEKASTEVITSEKFIRLFLKIEWMFFGQKVNTLII